MFKALDALVLLLVCGESAKKIVLGVGNKASLGQSTICPMNQVVIDD